MRPAKHTPESIALTICRRAQEQVELSFTQLSNIERAIIEELGRVWPTRAKRTFHETKAA
jgi:hypothetical protein